MSTDIDLRGIGMTSQRTRSRLVERLREQGILSEHVLDVISATPRHALIDEALAHRAYEDTALPIGFNQTISQPYIVARMTEALLADGPVETVLEVGTGSGYQTAILAQLAAKVYTVERIGGLLTRAKERLGAMGYRNIFFRHSDGGLGWPEKGPFDAIIVTASPRIVPEALLDQLADNGRMLVPVGESRQQELLRLVKSGDDIEQTVLESVKFVPLLAGKS
ncbi:MAG: protein-L-isoaspartate(D-aspartate) O-methyltransferase [Gammaproteobacteria bacterium]|jgi:protein-L-isoaspartate(D-aspartate) O-methyltransferase|nr:protein-L-isoaspartate(D-aspartate) O-methyltransferase [Gammaproteobacteria bacterium]MBT4492727.1 protein-L-isoaspartate(D-aspartate) O-methyltransferase [Gammaproteobacteria bacterium]MBT7370828.1 protein-L-isoaspartate(D-aspartate) O-methyltransferase [Gammaproteobacteria bacterium]